jgi:hypothetical protein
VEAIQLKIASPPQQRGSVTAEDRLHHHSNVEATQLLDETTVRRLKRLKPFELV